MIDLLKYSFSILLLVIALSATAQTNESGDQIGSITIDECYQWTRANYPLVKNLDIIDKTTTYSIHNASKGNLPQINLNGQATYQSAVTELLLEIPNMEIPTLDKDQYKVYGEIYQPLTNFSNVNAKKAQMENNGTMEKQQLEIDLYRLKDQVNQIYFGTLLIDEKIAQLEIIQSDLDSTLVKIEAAIANGTATLIDKQLLNVEQISLSQQIDKNKANQLAFVNMLSALIGKNITANTTFIKPTIQEVQRGINRPELQLFSLQNQSILIQQEQIKNSLTPNIGLFAQVGYGRPALNFLSNEFEPYYIGGIKFSWNLSSFYTYKNTKNYLNLVSQKIATQQETFLLNTNLTQSQQSAEVDKFERLMKSDQEIVAIREIVLETAKVQLDNGLITTIDYVKFLNDVNKARQMRLLHETQLLLAQYNLKNTTGN